MHTRLKCRHIHYACWTKWGTIFIAYLLKNKSGLCYLNADWRECQEWFFTDTKAIIENSYCIGLDEKVFFNFWYIGIRDGGNDRKALVEWYRQDYRRRPALQIWRVHMLEWQPWMRWTIWQLKGDTTSWLHILSWFFLSCWKYSPISSRKQDSGE